jgi:MoaA/NifB/PqqE/SkfB family radical SAM enzyme
MIDRISRMAIRLGIVDLDSYPKAVKEVLFLMGMGRYWRRKAGEVNEWRDMLKRPPVSLGLNVTDVCNAKCVYCAYRFHKPEGVMDMAVYEKAVRDYAQLGGGVLGLSNMTGDPLLDPHLAQRIEFAAQFKNISYIFFSTNGIGFKNKEIIDELFRLSSAKPIKIDISLPGFEKKMFERVYDVGDYEKVLEGMRYLLETNKTRGLPLDITLRLQPDRGGVFKDPDYIKYIKPYISENNVLCSSRVENNWCGQIKQEHLTGQMVLRRPVPDRFRDVPCRFLTIGNVDILVNGDVRVCGCTYGAEGKHDTLVIGNIMEKSLAEIWFGEGRRKICEQFVKLELPGPCKQCFMYDPY